LEEKSTNFDVLHMHPTIKNVSQIQDPITSSVQVERLFSYAGMVPMKKRGSVSDVGFEQQLLLKANRHLLYM